MLPLLKIFLGQKTEKFPDFDVCRIEPWFSGFDMRLTTEKSGFVSQRCLCDTAVVEIHNKKLGAEAFYV